MESQDLIRRAAEGDDEAADRLVGEPDLLPAVLTALDHAKPVGLLDNVVIRMSRPSAVPTLIDALASGSYDVRRASALALGRSGDRRALEPLLAMLDEVDLSEPDRSFAADALGDLGDPAAIHRLHATVDATRPDLEWNDWPILLIRCAVALAKLGDHSAAGAVLAALASEMETARSLAARALCIVTAPGMTQALGDRLRDRSREVRLAVIEPLFLLGTVGAVEALIPACEDDVDDVALRALLRLGDLLGEEFDDDDGEQEAREAWDRHRESFLPQTCHRWGRPLQVHDLLAGWESVPNRRTDLAAELTIVTGLPVSDIIRDEGFGRLRERVLTTAYVAGGLYKWGRPVPVP
jgi:HEAT repeat protein